jgi:hypothetical protein
MKSKDERTNRLREQIDFQRSSFSAAGQMGIELACQCK